ncbi:hypothetical protein LTR87_012742 [Friedmanniomyces endolithicus]|nr:hypothetical protein LTR87_012742 [Friedmanniomyces endolithicus]
MFGKSAPKEPEPAVDSSDTVEKASTENDSGDEIAKPDDKTDETADDKPADKPEKKKSSWWSILTNPSNLSLLNTVFQEVTANTEQGEMPTKEQLMKSVDKNKVKMPDQEQLMKTLNDKTPNTPEKEQLMQALAAQQNANGLLQKALSLKDTAMKAMNPQERQKMMQEAYDKEIEANGQSKWARRLQSGTWQGGMGGAGVGGGVGGITGPFVKLNQDKAKEIAAREKAKGKSDEEVMETVKSEAGEEVTAEAIEDIDRGGAGTPHTPASGTAAVGQSGHSSAKGTSEKQHSGGKTKTPPARDPNAPRKKPKKLEVRSAKKPVASS